jgi:hypothetical protein
MTFETIVCKVKCSHWRPTVVRSLGTNMIATEANRLAGIAVVLCATIARAA